MLFSGVLGVVAFIVWMYCIIDVVTTPGQHVRNLPKLVWLLIVILLFDIGAVAWLIFGHAWSQPGPGTRLGMGGRGGTDARTRAAGGRTTTRTAVRPTNPDDDDEFLATLSARAEEQRRAREADNPLGDEPPGPTPAP